MTRIVLSTIAAIALFGAGAAIAQDRPSQDRGPGQQGGPQHQSAPQHPGATPHRDNFDKPQARKGDRWNRHVRACKARYRSYSPQRDAFRNNRGNWVRCRL